MATGTAGRTRTHDARLNRCILLRGAGGAPSTQDHSSPKRPRSAADPPPARWNLCSLAGERLPLEILHSHTGSRHRERRTLLRLRATSLLQDAERPSPDDVEVLLYLAELYRNGNREADAVPLYRRAIRLGPTQVTASVGLGGISVGARRVGGSDSTLAGCLVEDTLTIHPRSGD